MTCLVIGASTGLGRALVNRLAKERKNLIIVSSDSRDLAAVESDLTNRHEIRVKTIAYDVTTDDGYLTAIETAARDMGAIDGLFFPIGAVVESDRLATAPDEIRDLTEINYLAVAKTVSYLYPKLPTDRRVVIVGFGSIAGARGRSANIAYAAAKRALETLFESLRHATSGTNVWAQFYVLGYLETNLAFGARTMLPRASLKTLCDRVVRDLDRDVGLVYYPRYWRFVCSGLRLVPWSLFKRLSF
jgi:short-subunit dehydrogenase